MLFLEIPDRQSNRHQAMKATGAGTRPRVARPKERSPRDSATGSTVIRQGQSERSDAGVALLLAGGGAHQLRFAFTHRFALEGDVVDTALLNLTAGGIPAVRADIAPWPAQSMQRSQHCYSLP